MPTRTKVLFLCIGNACRSQMAEAIARHLAADVIEGSSAGLAPFGDIPVTTIAVLASADSPPKDKVQSRSDQRISPWRIS